LDHSGHLKTSLRIASHRHISLQRCALRKNNAALAKTFDSFIVRFPETTASGRYVTAVLNSPSRRHSFCFHCSLPSRQGRFALGYASLAPMHFALGNVVRSCAKLMVQRRDNERKINVGRA